GGALGFVVFLLAGSSIAGLWVGIVLMGLFTFAESPQLQALLADIAPPATRDASYALYFTMAFGFGSLWTAVYGQIIDTTGEPTGAAPDLASIASGPSRCWHRPPHPTPRTSRRFLTPGRSLDPAAWGIIRQPCANGHSVGAWRSLVARIVRDDEVGGSNPLAP